MMSCACVDGFPLLAALVAVLITLHCLLEERS